MLENVSIEDSSIKDSSLKHLNITDRLALIGLIHDGIRHGSEDSPVATDLYEELWDLVNTTVSGAKIDKLNVGKANKGFRTLEINSEEGANLGRLNMLYLNKPIPCYYLVYVEVSPPFRNKGLGNLILREFKDFLIEKSAIGALDNIIPSDDPTFEIYRKLDWRSFREVTGGQEQENGNDDAYMIYIPPAFNGKDLKDPIIKLVHHIKRKRPSIDMRDNEQMVQRTIEEFKDLYQALLIYFREQIDSGKHDSLMRFMFTRYVTKLLGFRRRISQLLGYTGGESMEQISLDLSVRNMPAQSYGPAELRNRTCFVSGDRELWLRLPEQLKSNPARFIEALPNYKRPSFIEWLKQNNKNSEDPLTLGDLLNIGFDPTRLKELEIDGESFIFERTQIRALPRVESKKEFLTDASRNESRFQIRNTRVRFNPPLLIIRDRGNAYVLRRKVPGIHWEEALEQLQTTPALKELNNHLGLERIISRAVTKVMEKLRSSLNGVDENVVDPSGVFVSWDLKINQPRVLVDISNSHLETLWVS